MSGIPAASIVGIDLERIRQTNPSAAAEIERIGQLMHRGNDTDQEFAQLCELLFVVGEKEKAKGLLIANASVDDDAHLLLRRLFGIDPEEKFRSAIRAFSEQMGVILVPIGSNGVFQTFFACSARNEPPFPPTNLQRILEAPCEADIAYRDIITADVYSIDEERPTNISMGGAFAFNEDGQWIPDRGGLPDSIFDGQ